MRWRIGVSEKTVCFVCHKLTALLEDALYYKVRGYHHDLLRARNITEFSDSEESEGEDDNEDEDEDEKMQRRDRLEAQRRETKARVEKIRKRHSPPAEYKNVDKVTEWMDLEMGYQEKVRSAVFCTRVKLTGS